ncbi:MAG: endonuclease/exonuclease/phosphatase family protein [Pseudomonadota bacterium]
MSNALLITETCDVIPTVPEALKRRIEGSPKTADAHRELLRDTAAMHVVEHRGTGSSTKLRNEFTVAAWNLERCLDPEGSAALLLAQKPDIVLLSEMDSGMARTGQRHTTSDVAALLDMEFAYGVEFFELGLGSPIEQKFATYDFNRSGFDGNAVLSSVSLDRVCMIRLDDHGQWFCGLDGAHADQPRIGGRMAVAAVVESSAGPICFVSTHLESTGIAWWRLAQMERLMSAIDAFAPDMPVIVGGDLNTGNNIPGGDWRDETLFAAAERRGYSCSNNADGLTTRTSRISSYPKARLDWFAHRDCEVRGAHIIEALDAETVPLSDHELIVGQFSIA